MRYMWVSDARMVVGVAFYLHLALYLEKNVVMNKGTVIFQVRNKPSSGPLIYG